MTTQAIHLARWLHANVTAIAASEDFDLFFTEIAEVIRDIERAVDVPVVERFLGPCPGPADSSRCEEPLVAPKHVKQIRCHKCKSTYDVEKLIADKINEIPHRLLVAEDILRVMGQIDEAIPERTWRRWRSEGHVVARGELYGKPAYVLSEVRAYRNLRTKKQAS